MQEMTFEGNWVEMTGLIPNSLTLASLQHNYFNKGQTRLWSNLAKNSQAQFAILLVASHKACVFVKCLNIECHSSLH